MKPENSAGFRRFPRTLIVCMATLLSLVVSVSAFSDTYNFYFTKPNKKAGADSQNADENRDSGNEATESGTTPPRTPVTTAPAPGVAAAGPVTPNGQSPIVINNNNNIQMPQTAAEPEPENAAPEKPAEPQTPAVQGNPQKHDDNSLSASVTASNDHSPWRFGLSGILMTGNTHWMPGSSFSGYTYDGYWESASQWGGLVSLGYFFTRSIGINAYGGGAFGNYASDGAFLFGGDLELLPFRITLGHLDVIELGLLAGGRTGQDGSSDFEIHGGARVNINFDRHFGLTAALRTNFKTAMLEGGLITHF